MTETDRYGNPHYDGPDAVLVGDTYVTPAEAAEYAADEAEALEVFGAAPTVTQSMTADEIVAALNEYEDTHDTSAHSGPRVHNIWQDIILVLPGYDEEATSAYDTGQNDRFVTRVEGEVHAHLIRHDPEYGRWFDSMTLT